MTVTEFVTRHNNVVNNDTDNGAVTGQGPNQGLVSAPLSRLVLGSGFTLSRRRWASDLLTFCPQYYDVAFAPRAQN